jgi:hypothetical protein
MPGSAGGPVTRAGIRVDDAVPRQQAGAAAAAAGCGRGMQKRRPLHCRGPADGGGGVGGAAQGAVKRQERGAGTRPV